MVGTIVAKGREKLLAQRKYLINAQSVSQEGDPQEVFVRAAHLRSWRRAI